MTEIDKTSKPKPPIFMSRGEKGGVGKSAQAIKTMKEFVAKAKTRTRDEDDRGI